MWTVRALIIKILYVHSFDNILCLWVLFYNDLFTVNKEIITPEDKECSVDCKSQIVIFIMTSIFIIPPWKLCENFVNKMAEFKGSCTTPIPRIIDNLQSESKVPCVAQKFPIQKSLPHILENSSVSQICFLQNFMYRITYVFLNHKCF